MSRHTFDRDIRAAAKENNKSLVAFAYRGKSFEADFERPIDHATGLKLVKFISQVFGNPSAADLIPDLELANVRRPTSPPPPPKRI